MLLRHVSQPIHEYLKAIEVHLLHNYFYNGLSLYAPASPRTAFYLVVHWVPYISNSNYLSAVTRPFFFIFASCLYYKALDAFINSRQYEDVSSKCVTSAINKFISQFLYKLQSVHSYEIILRLSLRKIV